MRWEECARVGALAEKTPTKRTNVLVVGDINPAVLRPGSNVTGKARKAFALQDKGQDIEVMTEDDFLRCLDGGEFRKFDLDTAATAAAADRKTIPATNAGPPRLPKPLRREGSATEQACSEPGCESMAAFKTRSKPTWCTHHIDEILRVGGLTPLESFTRPDDWRLTECRTCGCVAHYRFVYTLAKNAEGEPTCRACYWRAWARSTRALQGAYANVDPVPYEKAQALAEEHGYIYLGPLTQPSLPDDPHRTQCRRCGKISAERLGDISFGCTCATR